MSTAEDGVMPSLASPSSSSEQPLGPGWERVLSSSRGSFYYVNREERKTTWDAKEAEMPAWPKSPTPKGTRRSESQTDLRQPLAPGWEVRWSRSDPNRFYYVHLETGRTTWNAQEARRLPGAKLNHPGYWRHAGREEEFLELVHTPSIFRHVQMLLASTFLSIRTRDRNSRMPMALEALKVWRVENSAVWQHYSTARERLRGLAAGFGGARVVKRCNPPPKTSQLLPDRVSSPSGGTESPVSAKCLDESVNEAYLFHGTSPASALGIVNSGFDISKAVGSACYGPGIYFAECSSKSDEYSTEERDGLHKGDCAMLLCRVLLGRVLHWQQEFSPELAAAWAQGCYDSVLGDRASLRGTYREFVLPPESCMGAYPEYLIVYRRHFEKDMV